MSGKHKKTDGSEPPAKMRLEPASVRLIYPDKRSNLSWGSALFAARLGIRSFVTGRSRTTTGAAIHDFRERAHVAIDRVDKTRNFICWLNNSVRVDDSGDLVIKSRCLVDQIRRSKASLAASKASISASRPRAVTDAVFDGSRSTPIIPRTSRVCFAYS